MIDLSISVVAYKNYDDIIKAIDTLEMYTSETINKKIYIIDNGRKLVSNDEFEKLKNSIHCYSDVQYIDNENNVGFGKAHNKALSLINSRYHCIMNPDIIFFQDAFIKILNYLDHHNNVGMVIPKIIDEKGNLQLVYRKEVTIFDMFIRMFCKGLFSKRYKQHTLQYMDYTKTFQVPFGQGSFLVIRTDLLKSLHGFDDHFFMYMEDADLCKRVNQVSKLIYLPNAVVIHKWEKGSHKNKTLFKYHVDSMKYYFKKWGMKLF